MKNFKINIKDIEKPDLLDGQRRGEVIFRRMVVIALAYWGLMSLAGNYLPTKDEVKQEVKTEAKQEQDVGVDGAGNEWKDGDIVDGQRVEVDDEGRAWFVMETEQVEEIEKEAQADEQVEAIRSFTSSYRGSRIDAEYFELLRGSCTTTEGLKLVVAISVAESGMGRDLPNRTSNFWGWFKGGDRTYDPSREIMAQEICRGIEAYYMGVNADVVKAQRYVGYNPTSWMANVNWALNQIEAL